MKVKCEAIKGNITITFGNINPDAKEYPIQFILSFPETHDLVLSLLQAEKDVLEYFKPYEPMYTKKKEQEHE